MPTLREIQLDFAEALMSEGAARRFAPLVRPRGLDAVRRLRLYHNNLVANLSGALEAVYPVIHRLVGDACFDSICRAYVRAHPSRSGDIHDYGECFGAFLGAQPVLADCRYLTDVATLEWAYHRVFHTEPAPALALKTLRDLGSEAYPGLRFALQPAARMLVSAYPVLRIWQVNQPDWSGDRSVELAEGGAAVLVARRGLGIELESLPLGEAAWIQALAQGRPLVAALEAALERDPRFDLAPALARRLAQGVLVAPAYTHSSA